MKGLCEILLFRDDGLNVSQFTMSQFTATLLGSPFLTRPPGIEFQEFCHRDQVRTRGKSTKKLSDRPGPFLGPGCWKVQGFLHAGTCSRCSGVIFKDHKTGANCSVKFRNGGRKGPSTAGTHDSIGNYRTELKFHSRSKDFLDLQHDPPVT